MKPSEVRQRILADHEALRAELVELEKLARQVLDGERSLLGPLRDRGEALLAKLREHMSWEDAHLTPALRAADAWGEERAGRLAADHREQREMLGEVLAGLRDRSRPAAMVARELAALVAVLRDDMVHEEECLIAERVLRDDVTGIDVEAG